MPHTKKPELRKHLTILLIALALALAVLLVWTESANSSVSLGNSELANAQIFTTERLILLGMLGLVVATYAYLRWRPPYDSDGHSTDERE